MLSGEVVDFEGVVGEVVKGSGSGISAPDNQFMGRGDEATPLFFGGLGELALASETGVLGGIILSGKERCEVRSRTRPRIGQADEAEEGGHNVDRVDQGGVGSSAFQDPGPMEDEGHAQGFFLRLTFVHLPVGSGEFAMVGGEDNEGVPGEAGLFEKLEEASDFVIKGFAEAVVAGEGLPGLNLVSGRNVGA